MANPNIVNVTSITGNTVVVAPIGTSGNTILSNSDGSNIVYKINKILITNITNAAVSVNVAFNSAASSAGSNTFIACQIAVPGNASLIVTDKSTSFYLPENRSINVLSGAASALHATLSFEEIS